MSKKPILQPEQSYTFRSYFELNYEADEILLELGYKLNKETISLPLAEKIPDVQEIYHQINKILPLVNLSSETARREVLVAPILVNCTTFLESQLRIEYPIYVNEKLKGNLDYLLRLKNNLLIVEAKNDDLTKGFTQLSVELIALSYLEEDKNIFYGAVTTGEIWRFGKLDKQLQTITQDLELYRIPSDFQKLFSIIIGILTSF